MLDANDHSPVVTPMEPVTLSEAIPVDSIVTVISATDEDQGINSALDYILLSGNSGGTYNECTLI